MSLRVEADHLQLERLLVLHHVARVEDAIVGEFTDMDEPLEAVAHAHEGAEVHQLRDGALHKVADLDIRNGGMPWVWLQLADGEADAAALRIDVDHFGVDHVAHLVIGLRVRNLRPADLALMDEAVDSAKVDEEAERRNRAHAATHLLADREGAEELVTLLASLLIVRNLLREDQAIPLAVHLKDLHAQLAANVRLQLLGDLLDRVARCISRRTAWEVNDLADRHEAANATINDESTLVVINDGGLNDGARVQLLLHGAPLALQAGAADGEDNVSVFRLRLHHIDKHRVANVEGWTLFAVSTVQLAA